MSDSPFYKAPTDAREQPILDKLLILRDKLLLLKQDRTQYIKSQDVMTYYDELIEHVHAINDLRVNKREEQNRLDVILDDCFSLMSLFFLTIGRNNEAPAAYAVASTVIRLLDHLKEAGFFTHADLDHIQRVLMKIRSQAEAGKKNHSEHMLLLLETRINICETILAELQTSLSLLSPELMPVYDRLVMVLRSLAGLNTRATFPVDEVRAFQKQLKNIEAGIGAENVALLPSELSIEDRFVQTIRHVSYDANAVLPGKEVIKDLLARCYFFSEIIMKKRGTVDERFKDKFDELMGIRNQLEKLSLTKAWSLRETDLYGYQRRLDRIDESRVDGNFLDAEGKPAEIYEQRALLYLIRKCYATIYHMITSSEPVSEALLPVYNQLLTLRKCLVEVKKSGGVHSPRELYPYSMKLNSIDNMREDGKFIINGDIPEGQASVAALLSECFDMAYELRTEAEEQEADEEMEDTEDDDDTLDGHKVDVDDVDMDPDDHDEGMGLARTVSRKPGCGPVGVAV